MRQENVSTADGASSNALSLFGQSANANDFPVLKAFQEYIDAEQSKARKRMLGLSIFFVVLLVLVVVTFTVITTSIFTHNRELSDRLLDVAFRERLQQTDTPVVAASQPIVQPVITPSQDSGIKPILEKLEALTTALATRQQQSVQPSAPVVVTAVPATTVTPTPVSQAESIDAQQMKETIKKQKIELEIERNRLREMQEKLRQAEIERHRRRLYPEYYAQQDVAESKSASSFRKSVPPSSATAANSRDEQKKTRPPLPMAHSTMPLKSIKPINYFAQNDIDELPLAPTNKAVVRSDSIQQQPEHSVSNQLKTPAQQTMPPQTKDKVLQVPKQTGQLEKNAKLVLTNVPSLSPPATRTETLDIGTSSENLIPWLIEDRSL